MEKPGNAYYQAVLDKIKKCAYIVRMAKNIYTKNASYELRLSAWRQAIDAAEKHIKIGITLQGQGGEILRSCQHNTDAEQAAKLIQQGTSTLEKGVKLERDARDKLIDLYQQEPRQ